MKDLAIETGFLNQLEKAQYALISAIVMSMLIVQAATTLLASYFDIPIIKAGIAISFVFYTASAITFLGIARNVATLGSIQVQTEYLFRKGIIKWGLFVALIALILGATLQSFAPQLFATIPFQIDYSLNMQQAFSIIPI